jgi:hypothetical protein
MTVMGESNRHNNDDLRILLDFPCIIVVMLVMLLPIHHRRHCPP